MRDTLNESQESGKTHKREKIAQWVWGEQRCHSLRARSWERTDIHTCIAESLGYTPSGSDGKESAYNARDLGSIPGLDKSPGEGNGYPLQYSCMENSMDRESWWATVHGITRELDMTEQWTHKSTVLQFFDKTAFVNMTRGYYIGLLLSPFFKKIIW